jgi:hypothetical protein
VVREYENECENVWVREKKIECVRENERNGLKVLVRERESVVESRRVRKSNGERKREREREST